MPPKWDNPSSFAQSDNIHRVDKDSHCAEFVLRNYLVGLSRHSVEQFKRRFDNYVPNDPTAFVLMKRRMMFMEKNPSNEEEKFFYDDDEWRFVVKEISPKKLIVLTCFSQE